MNHSSPSIPEDSDRGARSQPPQQGRGRAYETAVIAVAFVIIVAGIHLAQSVLLPFLLSAFIAVLATGPLRWLKAKHVPSGVSVLLVVIGLLVIFAIFMFLIVLSVRSITESLPLYQDRFQMELAEVKAFLKDHGVEGTDQLFQKLITPQAAADVLIGFLSSAASAFSNFVLIILTIIFILLEESTFPAKLRVAFGDPDRAFPHFRKFANDLKRVVVIQTAISLSTGIIIGIWLTVLGLDFTILLGLFTFLFNFVPNIGSVIAAVPAIALAFLQYGLTRAILVALGFFAVGSVVGNFLQPRLMGENLGLSNLVVFLSVIFWGSLLGVIGMILCVPFTLALKFALESSEQTKWIACLLERVPHTHGTPVRRGKA